jgi:hypothetical protein
MWFSFLNSLSTIVPYRNYCVEVLCYWEKRIFNTSSGIIKFNLFLVEPALSPQIQAAE